LPELEMLMGPAPRSCLLAVACLIVAACDVDHGPRTVPTAPPPVQDAPTPVTIRIVSGDNFSPVEDATVSTSSERRGTNHLGEVMLSTTVGDAALALDIDAPGFLPRRTRLNMGPVFSLWPVNDDVEAQATRAMVYGRPAPFGEILMPVDQASPYFVSLSGDGIGTDLLSAWASEAQALSVIMGVTFEVSGRFRYETNEISVRFGEGTGCTALPAWGFCLRPPPYKTFEVRPALARDPQTIRRVLASAFLGANPLPGFMNAEAPSDTLTRFELLTIQMILQRRLPNRWPDSDR
jgi:hypothetical protein